MTYARRHGGSSVSLQLWPPPVVSSASRISPGRNKKCFPSRVWKSSVPLSVMTNCLTGASCQAKAPPEAVSSNEIVVVVTLPLSISPRAPGSRSMTPSSECEFRSSPVHIRTHRIMALLLLWLPPVPCAILDRQPLSAARSSEEERQSFGKGW